jgi:hypothetical protein
MTTSEEPDDPFSAHFKRDPLPGAGIRVILLTKLAAELATPMITPLLERISEQGRAVEHQVVPVGDLGLAESLRRGLEGARLPLVLVTTAAEPDLADHLGPLLSAINKGDHVIGRRPQATGASFSRLIAWLFRRLIFAVPLDDVHSPCRLHRLEKLLAIPFQSASSFLDTEILAKATFLGHLIDEVDVPPLRCHSWNEHWWIDARRLLKHPQFEAQSRPAEVAQGQPKGHDSPGAQDQQGVSHVVESGSFENHLT